MPLAFEPSNIGYLAYIDEAGDPGLTKVRGIDPQGASEWLSIGAIVIQAKRENDVAEWVRSIRKAVGANQGPALHFRTLDQISKYHACTELAALPLRGFVLVSNKKNMRQYRNERAAKARPTTQEWFYNWCIKLLIERITDFVERHSLETYKTPMHVKFVFSERGGTRYAQTTEYHEIAREQARSGTTRLTKRIVRWQVMHPASNEIVVPSKNAGVQLADIVASSFYQAANADSLTWDTTFAKALKPIIPLEVGRAADYGVTLQPEWRKANLTKEQQEIFRFYGYPLK